MFQWVRLVGMSARKGGSILPWLALGPVTGPMAWRMYRCIRSGDHVLAGLYAVAIVGYWVVLIGRTGQAVAALAQ